MSKELKPTNVDVPLAAVIEDGTPVQAHEVSVIVEGPTSVTAKVAPKQNNQVSISFSTTVPGDYKIKPVARGQALQHSPVTVTVKEGKPEDSHVPPPPPVASYPVRVEVDANDADGKPLPDHAVLKAEATGPEPVNVKVTRTGNRLRLEFETTRQKGTFQVHVSHNGRAIERSPFELTLTGKSSSATEEIVKLPSLSKTRQIQFSVPPIGPNKQTVRAADVTASIAKGPELNAKCDVVDQGGNLLVSIHVQTPGKYEVAVKLRSNGQEIEGSTFDITVPPEAFQK